jgi:uncharacterized protein YaaQ
MTSPDRIDRLAILVVSGSQSAKLQKRLKQREFHFTEIDSMGGIFQEPSVCLLVGLSQERLSELTRTMQQCCMPIRRYLPTRVRIPSGQSYVPMIETQVGGAIFYVLKVDLFEYI